MKNYVVNISLSLMACASLLALNACVDTRPYKFPAGVTVQQFNKDYDACSYDVAKAQASNDDAIDRMVAREHLVDMCMANKGYSK